MVRRIERVAWPAAGLTWLWLTFHSAHALGIDFPAVYRGPHDLIHRLPPYPTTSKIDVWGAATHQPFYVHTPSAPIVLSPIGVLPYKAAGALFVVVSVAAFLTGAYLLARRTPVPGLILLGLGLCLPVRDELGLVNADLLAAGLLTIAVATRGPTRAVTTCLAIAVKPTAWALALVLGVPGLAGLAGAVVLNLIGFAIVPGSSRFVHYVIPYLAHGQQAIDTVRTSLPDAAASAAIPHSTASAIATVLLIGSLGWILMRRGFDCSECAPLVVLLVLVLSAYSFPAYAVYLLPLLPLLWVADQRLGLLGAALYLICVPDAWVSSGLPHWLNTVLNYKVLGGLLLLFPIVATPLTASTRALNDRDRF